MQPDLERCAPPRRASLHPSTSHRLRHARCWRPKGLTNKSLTTSLTVLRLKRERGQHSVKCEHSGLWKEMRRGEREGAGCGQRLSRSNKRSRTSDQQQHSHSRPILPVNPSLNSVHLTHFTTARTSFQSTQSQPPRARPTPPSANPRRDRWRNPNGPQHQEEGHVQDRVHSQALSLSAQKLRGKRKKRRMTMLGCSASNRQLRQTQTLLGGHPLVRSGQIRDQNSRGLQPHTITKLLSPTTQECSTPRRTPHRPTRRLLRSDKAATLLPPQLMPALHRKEDR